MKSKINNTFLKTVSTFSNFSTGQILFGVKDSGDVVGMKDSKAACLMIENKVNDSIEPKPGFSLEVNSKTKVITLTV